LPSGVGLYIKPARGTGWGTLNDTSCNWESSWTGSMAAEVKVLGKKQTSNELVFSKPVKSMTLDSGKVVETGFNLFSTSLTIAGQDELTFPEATEVT
jgi:hypothetical protein